MKRTYKTIKASSTDNSYWDRSTRPYSTKWQFYWGKNKVEKQKSDTSNMEGRRTENGVGQEALDPLRINTLMKVNDTEETQQAGIQTNDDRDGHDQDGSHQQNAPQRMKVVEEVKTAN
jgi:hypothetical protein